jgi:hypothetical protein
MKYRWKMKIYVSSLHVESSRCELVYCLFCHLTTIDQFVNFYSIQCRAIIERITLCIPETHGKTINKQAKLN